MSILEFRGKYRFLSNFYPCMINMDGMEYPSTEHAFQAAKTLDHEVRDTIRLIDKAWEVRKYGRDKSKVKLRDGWNSMRIEVMEVLVTQKFNCHIDLRKKLLATGDEELIEGNWWGDDFWGVCRGKGENNLGKILMRVRSKLGGQKE